MSESPVVVGTVIVPGSVVVSGSVVMCPMTPPPVDYGVGTGTSPKTTSNKKDMTKPAVSSISASHVHGTVANNAEESKDIEINQNKVKMEKSGLSGQIAEKIDHIFSSSSVFSDTTDGNGSHDENNVEKKKSMKMVLLDYEVTEVETDDELKSNMRMIQVKSTIDYLLTTEVYNFKTPLFFLVEFLKAIIFGSVTLQNVHSCAQFNPYVLLVSGLFIYPQMAVLWNSKIMKLFQILSYDIKDDVSEYVLLRFLAMLGLVGIEVLFAVATFWYLNTLTDVIAGVTSGLTMMVISNFDTILLSQITVYTKAYKTNAAKLEKFFGCIYYSQYFFVIFFSGLLYIIAISVATSNHSGYQSDFCGDDA